MACARPILSGFAARDSAGAHRCDFADCRVHSHASAGARTTFASSRAPMRRFARAASRPAESSRRGARVASRAAVDQVAGAADWSNVDPDYLHDSIADKLTYLNDFERSEVYAAIEIAFHAHDGQRRKSGEPFVTHPSRSRVYSPTNTWTTRPSSRASFTTPSRTRTRSPSSPSRIDSAPPCDASSRARPR